MKHGQDVNIQKRSLLWFLHQVVEAETCDSSSVSLRYHVLQATPCAYDTVHEDATEEMPPLLYLNAGPLIQIQAFALTHGPGAKIHGQATLEWNNAMYALQI